MTNYSGVEQDVMELGCELMDIISEIKGWKIQPPR